MKIKYKCINAKKKHVIKTYCICCSFPLSSVFISRRLHTLGDFYSKYLLISTRIHTKRDNLGHRTSIVSSALSLADVYRRNYRPKYKHTSQVAWFLSSSHWVENKPLTHCYIKKTAVTMVATSATWRKTFYVHFTIRPPHYTPIFRTIDNSRVVHL